MSKIQLKVQNLAKAFLLKKVFENLSFELTPGCYAILGPIGSGKSTLLSLLAGSISPDRGIITINGVSLEKRPVRAKKYLSYVPEGVHVYPFMTGHELINFIRCVKRSALSSETEKLLFEFGIKENLSQAFNQMTVETQRKCLIAAATLGNPDIYIFDQPTQELSDEAKDTLAEYLLTLQDKKIVIIVSSDMNFVNSLEAKKLSLDLNSLC